VLQLPLGPDVLSKRFWPPRRDSAATARELPQPDRGPNAGEWFPPSRGDIAFRSLWNSASVMGSNARFEYAYETVAKFPNHRIFLTGEIIHNPYVNTMLQTDGNTFLPDGAHKYDEVVEGDVVLIPASAYPRLTSISLRRRAACSRYDLRFCAERLEKCRTIRACRRHLGHSRKIRTRGDQGDLFANHPVWQRAVPCHSRQERKPPTFAVHCRRGDKADFMSRFVQALLQASIRIFIWAASDWQTKPRC